ncbi:MAG: NADH:ubiquinone oxidoreductase subunit F (NADH-binding) [Myxococcota bacterium]|jgi:NADH:ubiquinone oxidoreductase subunit F (NADH-binding)
MSESHPRSKVLHLLEEAGSLDPDVIRRVSQQTGVPEADVYGTGRFYDLLVRPGARVCQGLTCQVLGGEALATSLDQAGTPHHKASCLGWCDRAPVAVNDELMPVESGRFGALSPADGSLPMNLGGKDTTEYAALTLARANGATWVFDALEAAGLQGRGGAGFPAHFKWRSVAGQAVTERYVVCNADEAEPGTFKDRALMMARPHLLIEALAISAICTGVEAIYIYVRGEFPEARAALETAVADAAEHLEGIEFRFVSGHGAYICGEETALLESIEGKRGMPRLKPPYPTESGLFGKPTLINNVETLACVPFILQNGGEAFKSLGRTEAGSKLYCVSGHVQKPGVYELPLGATLDELVTVAGGYVGTPLAFSPGGASSGFLPMDFRETPLDFKSLQAAGSMLGSAGVVVLNETVDIAVATRDQAIFFEDESCGQCAPCRIGTRYSRQALDRYLDSGDPKHLGYLADVAWEMDEGSICGLGIAASLPILTAMRHFPDAFGPRQPKVEP